MIRVGFIGFGEVGLILSTALRQKGASVAAFDVLLDRANGREILERRAKGAEIRFCGLPELVSNADYVFSTVTTDKAEHAAEACAPHLTPAHVFVDLNATAPSVKRRVDRVVAASGARFVEGAILGAVGVSGAATRILLGGPSGADAARVLTELGLRADFYSLEIGRASAFKMLRSVFSKGLEALLIEFLIAGRRAGLAEELWEEVVDLFSQNTFERVAANWVQTHAIAHERRAHEMGQVVEVLREMGVDPVLTAGTEAFFRRSCGMGLRDAFPQKPDRMEDVIAFMEQKLGSEKRETDDGRV